MADIGFVRAQLGGIQDATTKRVLTTIFEHVLGNIRFGEPKHQKRAENMQAYYYSSTTASDTNEFSIVHGLGTTPSLAIPILDVRQVGAVLPSLTVSRAADASRVYLKASAGSTNVTFKLLIE